VFSARSPESPKRWSLYAECIPASQFFECEVSIDDRMVSEFGRKNAQTWFGIDFAIVQECLYDPISVWAEMGHHLWQREHQFFSRELRLSDALPKGGDKPIVRLGWGAGLLGTSIDMLLPDPLLREIRNVLFRDRGSTPAP